LGDERRILVIGRRRLAVASADYCRHPGGNHPPRRTFDSELRAALSSEIDGIAVLLHDDIKALRYSWPPITFAQSALFVAMFDRTAREQLRTSVPQLRCLLPRRDQRAEPGRRSNRWASRRHPAQDTQDEKRWVSLRRCRRPICKSPGYSTPDGLVRYGRLGRIVGQLRAYDAGSKVLLTGVLGLSP
jgi:hypothetical protein